VTQIDERFRKLAHVVHEWNTTLDIYHHSVRDQSRRREAFEALERFDKLFWEIYNTASATPGSKSFSESWMTTPLKNSKPVFTMRYLVVTFGEGGTGRLTVV
jgi:predicted metallo-beta-lactamase superfamily hydrolase